MLGKRKRNTFQTNLVSRLSHVKTFKPVLGVHFNSEKDARLLGACTRTQTEGTAAVLMIIFSVVIDYLNFITKCN